MLQKQAYLREKKSKPLDRSKVCTLSNESNDNSQTPVGYIDVAMINDLGNRFLQSSNCLVQRLQNARAEAVMLSNYTGLDNNGDMKSQYQHWLFVAVIYRDLLNKKSLFKSKLIKDISDLVAKSFPKELIARMQSSHHNQALIYIANEAFEEMYRSDFDPEQIFLFK